MSNLYIVATPIGNLQDISLRAMETLVNCDVIACEDTRRTGLLLQHIIKHFPDLQTKPRLLSYFEHNELHRIPEIIMLLKEGKDVSLVSDGGTPAISDPGFKLIRECIANDIRVESIPGPSAIISALVVSGLPTDKFLFVGYLPKKDSHKKAMLHTIPQVGKALATTIILYEAPHRLIETLQLLQSEFGDIYVVVASELTKMFEETKRGMITELIEYYTKKKPRGEYVILFHTKDIKDHT